MYAWQSRNLADKDQMQADPSILYHVARTRQSDSDIPQGSISDRPSSQLLRGRVSHIPIAWDIGEMPCNPVVHGHTSFRYKPWSRAMVIWIDS